ncbi:MAG: TldD/PmbA family protein [Candidatus Sabulitectum sp.]|nr:TldD/PmbA family protein [Candidatus Sabulitectum sp.]
MKQLVQRAVEILNDIGVDYGDVRAELIRTENTDFRNARLDDCRTVETEGVGIRVLVGGSWGFSACTGMNKDDVDAAVERAVDIARAAGSRGKVELAPLDIQQGVYSGPCEIDPFEISREDKIALLHKASDEMMKDPRIKNSFAQLWFEKRDRIIGSTRGDLIETDLVFSQPALMATAVAGGDAQSRALQDGARIAGWEWIEKSGIGSWGEKAREEALMKVLADESPSGEMDLILDGLHLGLTMHESVGHPTESDRALGWEANMAGRTFLDISHQGNLRYGSDMVNFLADNTLPYGVATWGWDDDMVPGKKWYTVKNGIFQEFGSVRETALLMGKKTSTGCCRAMNAQCFPINRQPNFYLEPPENGVTPEDLASDIDHGIWIEGRGSFSIDQRRENFQFGGDLFWEIRNGKKVRPLKKVIYRSRTPEFWGSLDGIADKKYFRTMGLLTCGKGEPMQSARMTHGASYSRFRGIEVGGGK